MALADRDYMRDPPKQRGRTTRLDAAPTDGVTWEAMVDTSPAATPPRRHRRAIVLALWLAGGIGVFTALWVVGCAIVGAQWHGQGTTFTPPTAQGGTHTGGSNRGTG